MQLGRNLIHAAILIPSAVGLSNFLFLNNIKTFLVCLGREEAFHHNLTDFLDVEKGGGGYYNLHFLHPFRLTANFIAFSFILVLPSLYYKIFKFRDRQDHTLKGIEFKESVIKTMKYLYSRHYKI